MPVGRVFSLIVFAMTAAAALLFRTALCIRTADAFDAALFLFIDEQQCSTHNEGKYSRNEEIGHNKKSPLTIIF